MPPELSSHEGHLIVLYDGLCGLCDAVVQFLLRHDTKDVFRFAPQQSDFARRVLARHGIDATTNETICVVRDCAMPSEQVFTKSDATLHIAKALGGIWKAALVARILPKSLLNAAYDFIARNRFRIFGRRTQCRLASPAQSQKFLE